MYFSETIAVYDMVVLVETCIYQSNAPSVNKTHKFHGQLVNTRGARVCCPQEWLRSA